MAKKAYEHKHCYGNSRTTVIYSSERHSGHDVRLQLSHDKGVKRPTRNQVRKLAQSEFAGLRFWRIARALGCTTENIVIWDFTAEMDLTCGVPNRIENWRHWD